MTWEMRQGGALALLREIPEASIRCCVTSPPYWGLRDYGTATWEGGDEDCKHAGRPKPRQDTHGQRDENHGRFAKTRGTQPSKAISSIIVRQICKCGARRVDEQLGLEATPEEYVARIVEIFREVRRALASDGTLWMNLGDSYCADHGQQTAREGNWGFHSKIPGSMVHKRRGPSGALKAKDMVGIPWRVAFALQADGWWLRSDIIWSKPNPMPESVADRPTKAHEYLFLLTKSARYFYDADAIRTPLAAKTLTTFGSKRRPSGDGTGLVKAERLGDTMPTRRPRMKQDGHGRRHEGFNERWETAEASGASFAGANARTVWTVATQPFAEAHFATFPEALVEPCILAGSAQGDLVLDPFSGSGTVGVVALRHGRRYLGLELNPAYVEMARRRIAGPLFSDALA